jgi:hypothetical protein
MLQSGRPVGDGSTRRGLAVRVARAKFNVSRGNGIRRGRLMLGVARAWVLAT